MSIATRSSYLSDIVGHSIRIALAREPRRPHRLPGHSVPAGYFAIPFVDTFNAYPHLLHLGLKQRFPLHGGGRKGGLQGLGLGEGREGIRPRRTLDPA